MESVTKKMSPSKHARYGPSRLEKMAQCPHYEPSEYQDTTAADEGTLCHEAVESGDLGILDTDEQVEVVTRCINFEKDLITSLGKDSEVSRERRVTLSDLTYGTLDLLVISQDLVRGILADWKFGRQAVTPAEDNLQIQAYVAAVFELYPTLETIEAHIVCPRQHWMSRWTFTRKDADKVTLRIIGTLARAGNSELAPTPHADACKQCGNKATCPSLNALVARSGEALEVPSVMDPLRMHVPEERTKAMVLTYILEDWGKQMRKRLLVAALEEGEEVPYFKIRTRAGNVSVTDPWIVVQAVLEAYDVDIADLIGCCTVKFSELVKVILQKKGGDDKKLIRTELESLIGDQLKQHDQVIYLQREGRISNEAIIKEIGS